MLRSKSERSNREASRGGEGQLVVEGVVREGDGFASTITSHGGILIVLESGEVSLGRPAENN
jgi:hypothetical protein